MRFIYGVLFGVLTSVIGAILYLAFADGQYLLQLSPRYHEMVSTIGGLTEAKEQRDQLTDRLELLAGSLDELTRRFNELRETGCGAATAHPPSSPIEPAPKPAEVLAPPTPKPRPAPTPVPPAAVAPSP
jgi:hypothetical protein